jgi:hypothetical protein
MRGVSAVRSVAVLVGCVVLATAIVQPATAGSRLSVDQLQFPLPLLVRGDLVEMGYDARRAPSATGFLHVRNDLQHDFTRVPLKLRKAKQQLVPSDGLRLLRAVVPGRLMRGQRLVYYAVVQDPKTGRSARVPARGTESAWIVNGAKHVSLGAHRFGETAMAEAVVARAGPEDVGFENPQEGARFGPWSFDVAPDGSLWVLDELNQRLLAWEPGQPDEATRSVSLPLSPIDFTLGPGGTLYVTRPANPTDAPAYPGGLPPIRLDRLSANGEVQWETKLATDIFNTQLRVARDGTVYWTGPFPSPRIERGSERRWTPTTTPGGQPLSPAEQNRRTLWGFQPLPGGLRFLAVTASFEADPVYGLAPHEHRFALVDRAGRLVSAWRVGSQTALFPVLEATPALVDGDPVVVLGVTAGSGSQFTWEYIVLRLAPHAGSRVRFSLSHDSPEAAWGDVITDVRIGPDGKLYQLGSSPETGIEIARYSLEPQLPADRSRWSESERQLRLGARK